MTRDTEKQKYLENCFREYSYLCQAAEQQRSGKVDLKRKQLNPAAINYCVFTTSCNWVQFEWVLKRTVDAARVV